MTIFKCKMCGGTLEINQGESVAVCEYCGTKQTLPRLDDERRANLYDRANHFRRNNEYDRATGIYEQILNEDSTDSEAYWSLVLCRYGIEYVEDPASRKRLPTVNRMQFTSVFDDENYRLALQYADGEQRTVYEEEANAINELQKGILAISEKEEPFDVFICYKETDANGRRTQDAVLANDLYHQLTQEGFKVFFARITLEDKLGTAYEPYIFAALNSAKVMVVLGTKPEHFNAVWVRNEWSRYLALIKSGDKKTLIPAYRDMDPYDLPEEFSHLQAQDMSKLGFMQDLIRGIGKIIQADKPKTVVREVTAPSGGGSTEGLLKRAYIYLEDGDWTSADQYCERVLDQDPENAMGYVGKLMAELHVHRQEELADCEQSFEENGNYQRALRFADDKLAGELKGYIEHIVERNEKARLEAIYTEAFNLMDQAGTQEDCEKAAELFESIKEYKDSAALIEKCHDKGEVCRKNNIYNEAFNLMNSADTQEDCEKVARMFESIQEYKDSAELIEKCYEKGKVCKEKAEEHRKATKQKTRKKALWMFAIVAAVGIFIGGMELIYTRAQNYRWDGQYKKAYRLYSVLLGYKDSDAYAAGCLDSYGWNLIKEGKYEEALKVFNKLYKKAQWDYQREEYSHDIAVAENQIRAATARTLVDEGKYEEALAVYENEVNGFDEEKENCRIAVKYGEDAYNKVKDVLTGMTYTFGSYEQDGDETNGPEDIQWHIEKRVVTDQRIEVMLVSKYALDYQPYHDGDSDVEWNSSVMGWPNCTLRAWLNETFINSAFNDYEKAMIKEVRHKVNDKGHKVNDKVYIVTHNEINGYADYKGFTEYTKIKAGITEENTENQFNGFWFCSEAGEDPLNCDAQMDAPPKSWEKSHISASNYSGVRPVLWISIDL